MLSDPLSADNLDFIMSLHLVLCVCMLNYLKLFFHYLHCLFVLIV